MAKNIFATTENLTSKANNNNAALTGEATLNGDKIATFEYDKLTLQNNWIDYVGFNQSYVSRVGCQVQLSGLIRSGVQDDPTTITVLPIAYRPKANIVTYISDGIKIARINIRTNGVVDIGSKTGEMQWLDLTQITYNIL